MFNEKKLLTIDMYTLFIIRLDLLSLFRLKGLDGNAMKLLNDDKLRLEKTNQNLKEENAKLNQQ